MEPVDRDMELLSNSMATYAHIKGKHTKKTKKKQRDSPAFTSAFACPTCSKVFGKPDSFL